MGTDGGVVLDHRLKQYRKNAADSLMLSREAMTQASHEYWVTMAAFWFQFAQHIEESEAAGSAPQIQKPGSDRHR